MLKQTLYNENGVQWLVFGRDPSKSPSVIDTNEYLIVSGKEAFLIDPGGIEIFPQVLTAVSEVIDLNQITGYLCSHQDPDVMSSLPLWLSLTPSAKIYLSWLWGGFVSHFGQEYSQNFQLVADEGQTITIGGKEFQLVPAHHCHSAGNFHLFDPQARILFSGDIGAALLPLDSPVFVENFEEHTRYMETFHKRWMPSDKAKNLWINRVRRLNPRLLCPQHGAIFRDEQVKNFLDWFADLEVGRLQKQAS